MMYPNYKIDLLQIVLFSICLLILLPFILVLPRDDFSSRRYRSGTQLVDAVGGTAQNFAFGLVNLRDRLCPNLFLV